MNRPLLLILLASALGASACRRVSPHHAPDAAPLEPAAPAATDVPEPAEFLAPADNLPEIGPRSDPRRPPVDHSLRPTGIGGAASERPALSDRCTALWTLDPGPEVVVLGSTLVGEIAGFAAAFDGSFHALLVASGGEAFAVSLGFDVAPDGNSAAGRDSLEASIPVGAAATAGDRFLLVFGTAHRRDLRLRARALVPEGRVLSFAPSAGVPGPDEPVLHLTDEDPADRRRLDLQSVDNHYVLFAVRPGSPATVPFAYLGPSGQLLAAGEATRSDGTLPLRTFALAGQVVLFGGTPADPVRCFRCAEGETADAALAADLAALEPGWFVGALPFRTLVARRVPGADGGAGVALTLLRAKAAERTAPFAFADGWVPSPEDPTFSTNGHLWRVDRSAPDAPAAIAYDVAGAVDARVSLPPGAELLEVSRDEESMLLRVSPEDDAYLMCSRRLTPAEGTKTVDASSALRSSAPPGARCGG